MVIGCSLGRMLATRFTLMYSYLVSQLILINHIGLEEWKAEGVPYQTINDIYHSECASNYTSIREYEQSAYHWHLVPAYDIWVQMLLGIYTRSEAESHARIRALITDAVYTQPVIYDFPLLAQNK